MTAPRFITAVFLLTGLMVLTGCLQQEEPAQTPTIQQVSDPIARGRLTYESHCMSCHGTDATGNGPVADLLTVPLPDLTLLSKRNNNAYPASMVFEQIDGRADTQAHGTREMPVWGNIWGEKDGVPQSEEQMQVQISELVEYIRTLQQ